MGDAKLWRLVNRGYDPQNFLRERARLMRVDGNSRGARGSTTKPGTALTKDQRAAISTAMERREAVPVKLPYLRFLDPAQWRVKT